MLRFASGGAGKAVTAGLLSAVGQFAEVRRERAQEVGGEPVPGELADLGGGDSAGVPENPQMVADGGLFRAGLVDQVAGAHLLGCEQFNDPEAERISEQGEDSGALTAHIDGCE